jgi:GxxExxY protein
MIQLVPDDEHLINDILDAALAVHSCLGCGFVETIYGRALATELRNQDLQIEREKLIKIWYGSHVVGKHLLDLVVNETVIVELKAASGIMPVHTAQLRSYLHATGYSAGLILNFGRPELQWERLQNTDRC